MCSDMKRRSKNERSILNEVITGLLTGFVSVTLKYMSYCGDSACRVSGARVHGKGIPKTLQRWQR